MTKPTSQAFFTAPSPASQKLELLRELFPTAVQSDADGRIRVDAAAIQQALDPANPAGIRVEEDGYELRWVGKREAYHSAFVPPQKIVQPRPEESKNWDATGNLLLKGDNLDALKLLRESYFGAIKLIYIDPPYNTQSDAFIYNDDFSAKQTEVLAQLGYKAEDVEYIQNIYGARTHSGWLSFMYPRLLLAKDLLRDDGVIFISIDDNEQAQLKLLCDEVFGPENFLGQIEWKKKTNGNNTGIIPAVHDHVLVFSKNSSSINQRNFGKPPSPEVIARTYKNPDNDPRGPWTTMDLSANHEGPTFPITNPLNGEIFNPPSGRYWVFNETEVIRRIEDGRIIFGRSGTAGPTQKVFLKDREGKRDVIESWWDKHGLNSEGTAEITEIFGVPKVFVHSKPINLLKNIIDAATAFNNCDIALDFFAGSGTTGEAVMRLNAEDGGNRQFILVQIPQPIDAKKQKEAHCFVTETLGKPEATIFEITAERLRRAGAKINADKPDVDTGFRIFEIAEDADALVVQKPLAQATQADLATFQETIATPQPTQLPRVLYNLLLAEGLPLTTRIEAVQGVQEGRLYRAGSTLFITGNIDSEAARPLLTAAENPITHISVYAPWVSDNNLLLGLKTLLQSLDLSQDKLRLRG
ncbi:site-specific DNA-methyltransferase [Lampropedia puyangensis]|uniref:site-specific DNA-methyltransferase (adenine-specific) n=1 Tax=Lampropedia puyangensis TaxID=1330072 RepID=A0A4S8EYJ1_9BURK|nr:site-specific DNA-methyltransferase [Lampropedia puyangensis]THT99340.1 site-specific DNA-methyltransferase [Lampropedia puyangensis]